MTRGFNRSPLFEKEDGDKGGGGGGDVTMITVKHGDEEIEVPAPDGWVSPESLAENFMPKSTFTAELGRRAVSIAREKHGMRKPEDLLDDADHIAAVVKRNDLVKKGSEVTGDGAPSAEQVTALRDDWRVKELKPVTDELATSNTRVQTLLGKALASEIVQAAAAAGIKTRFLEAPLLGQESTIVAMLGGQFGFDEKLGRHFVIAGDGFEITSDPEAQRLGIPYKTAGEFVASWAQKPENKDFIDFESKRGAGAGDPSRDGENGKDIVLTVEEASDHATYEAAQEKAHKRGGVVRTKSAPSPFGGPGGATV